MEAELKGVLLITAEGVSLNFNWWVVNGSALTAVGSKYTTFVQKLYDDGLLSGEELIEFERAYGIE